MIDARCVMVGDRLYAGIDEDQRDIMPNTNAILLQFRSIEDLKAAMGDGVVRFGMFEFSAPPEELDPKPE